MKDERARRMIKFAAKRLLEWRHDALSAKAPGGVLAAMKDEDGDEFVSLRPADRYVPVRFAKGRRRLPKDPHGFRHLAELT